MEHLADNLRRLFGLHALTTREASLNLGISEQALSELQSGLRSSPRFETILTIATKFEIPLERLPSTPFEDLLANELADPARYRRVEASLKRTALRRGRPRSTPPKPKRSS